MDQDKRTITKYKDKTEKSKDKDQHEWEIESYGKIRTCQWPR